MTRPLQIGILCETKTPPDTRVAITPEASASIHLNFPEIEIRLQSCAKRCFKDSEYLQKKIKVVENVDDCDVLFGVKEVKIEKLISNKTYLFFAHVGKKQPHNRKLLQEIIKKEITLIDYEYLTRFDGARVVAFGHWAGVVGAYNALLAEGLRGNYFKLKRAHEYNSVQDMYSDLEKIKLKPIKILLTGGGRVAVGALQTLRILNIKEVSHEQFVNENFTEPVYCRLDPWHYVKPKENRFFELQHFINYPDQYESIFQPYTHAADIYIPCHFWDPRSPVFISAENMRDPNFKISIISDISCDINGPIAATIRSSTIAQPFYDYDPILETEASAFENPANITVIAVDNLPGELPRDASADFSEAIIQHLLPRLIGSDDGMIQRATIVENGKLTQGFEYLSDFAKVDG